MTEQSGKHIATDLFSAPLRTLCSSERMPQHPNPPAGQNSCPGGPPPPRWSAPRRKVPSVPDHDVEDAADVVFGYGFMEQITHAVDEDLFRGRRHRRGKSSWSAWRVTPKPFWYGGCPIARSRSARRSAYRVEVRDEKERVRGRVRVEYEPPSGPRGAAVTHDFESPLGPIELGSFAGTSRPGPAGHSDGSD